MQKTKEVGTSDLPMLRSWNRGTTMVLASVTSGSTKEWLPSKTAKKGQKGVSELARLVDAICGSDCVHRVGAQEDKESLSHVWRSWL